MLSHRLASLEEIVPYTTNILQPLTPLVLFGRCAAATSPCHKPECVWYMWRDPPRRRACCLLAGRARAASSRARASDTLFLVAEEGWRLSRADCGLTPKCLAAEARKSYGGRCHDPSLSPDPADSPAEAHRRRVAMTKVIGDAAGATPEQRAKLPDYMEHLETGVYKGREKLRDD